MTSHCALERDAFFKTLFSKCLNKYLYSGDKINFPYPIAMYRSKPNTLSSLWSYRYRLTLIAMSSDTVTWGSELKVAFATIWAELGIMTESYSPCKSVIKKVCSFFVDFALTSIRILLSYSRKQQHAWFLQGSRGAIVLLHLNPHCPISNTQYTGQRRAVFAALFE